MLEASRENMASYIAFVKTKRLNSKGMWSFMGMLILFSLGSIFLGQYILAKSIVIVPLIIIYITWAFRVYRDYYEDACAGLIFGSLLLCLSVNMVYISHPVMSFGFVVSNEVLVIMALFFVVTAPLLTWFLYRRIIRGYYVNKVAWEGSPVFTVIIYSLIPISMISARWAAKNPYLNSIMVFTAGMMCYVLSFLALYGAIVFLMRYRCYRQIHNNT